MTWNKLTYDVHITSFHCSVKWRCICGHLTSISSRKWRWNVPQDHCRRSWPPQLQKQIHMNIKSKISSNILVSRKFFIQYFRYQYENSSYIDSSILRLKFVQIQILEIHKKNAYFPKYDWSRSITVPPAL